MAQKRLKQKRQSKNTTQDKIREENIFDHFFLLHIRKSLYVIIVWALSIIIHNLVFRFAGFDEPLFTSIAIYVIPAYLFISVIYTLSKHKRIEGKR